MRTKKALAELKRKLDIMGYGEYNLGIESVDLVGKLLDDVLETTSALRKHDSTSESEIFDNLRHYPLKNQYNDELENKNTVISEMLLDFVYVEDYIKQNEKNKESDIFQHQIYEMRADYETEIESRDKKIAQLENLIQSMTNSENHECSTCHDFQNRISQLILREKAMNERIAKLTSGYESRIHQLELIVQSSGENHRYSSDLEEENSFIKKSLSEKQQQYDKLRSMAQKLQRDLKICEDLLEEERKKASVIPELEKRLRVLQEKNHIDNSNTLSEFKQKAIIIQNLSDRLAENQKLLKESQDQVESSRIEILSLKEEYVKLKVQGEESMKQTTTKQLLNERESRIAISNFEHQIAEKTKEILMLQKILSDTRKQLATQTETTIPQLKTHIKTIERERKDIANNISRMYQIAVKSEKTQTGSSPVFFIIQQLFESIQTYL